MSQAVKHGDIINSPVGEIVFFSVAKGYVNKETGRREVKVKLKFDGNTAEGAAFREVIESVNPVKISTRNCESGFFAVSAVSICSEDGSSFVTVIDKNGNECEAPYFDSRIDTGSAAYQLSVWIKGNSRNAYLKAVAINELNLAERDSSSGSNNSLEELRASLRKAVA